MISATVGCRRYQDFVINGMETFFFNYGKTVSTHPLVFIGLCLVLTGLCAIGLPQIKRESNGMKLWIPEHSSQR